MFEILELIGVEYDARKVGETVFVKHEGRYFRLSDNKEVTAWVKDGTCKCDGVTVTESNWNDLPPVGTYWMVHRPGTSCSKMHRTRESAEAEARRLRSQRIGEYRVGEFRA